jgi:acetyltransferase-like isoleucine patch superfamily enzyme
MKELNNIVNEFNLLADDSVSGIKVIPGSLKKQGKERIYWLKNISYYSFFKEGVIIVSEEDYTFIINNNIKNNKLLHLVSSIKKPRLQFALMINKYFLPDFSTLFENCVNQHRGNKNIRIAENVFIGKNVVIGNGTVIYPNVVINSNTKIGENCVIKENSTIATEGLGYELFDSEWIKFPQIGGVVIGDNVEIGPHATIRKAALDETIIGNGSKIGSFVNIGHNCEIGTNAIFTSQCVVSGSSIIGDNFFMGVQSSTRHGVKLGNNITIGHGAAVTKNFGDNLVLVGNPAEPLDDYKKWSEVRKSLVSNP